MQQTVVVELARVGIADDELHDGRRACSTLKLYDT